MKYSYLTSFDSLHFIVIFNMFDEFFKHHFCILSIEISKFGCLIMPLESIVSQSV
jgi:hypothetical protein